MTEGEHDLPAPDEPEAPLPKATLRSRPEDFVVDEIPAYEPSGHGEHLFVTFRKVSVSTMDAVRDIAAALEVDAAGAGWAGLKDRHAVTTQTASFPFPIAREVEPALARIALPGITVLGAARHLHKLKPGHLHGNRFRITLRGVEDAAAARAALDEAARDGVPNAFGPQRFGRDGPSPERTLAWLAGRERAPRDRRMQRLLFSAVQSLLYNRVLERRVEDGTWAAVLPGDLAKKHDTGGLFLVPAEGPDLDGARERARACTVSATGPMFGAKMRWPEGAPRRIEEEVLSAAVGGADLLERHRNLGEGTRRPLRILVADLRVETETRLAPEAGAREPGSADCMTVSFVLPKGGYATTVLSRAFRLVDASLRGGPPAGSAAPDPPNQQVDLA